MPYIFTSKNPLLPASSIESINEMDKYEGWWQMDDASAA